MTAFNNSSGAVGDRIEPVAAAPGDVRLALTAAQLGVWTAQELEPSSPRYNCASCVELQGAIDETLLATAVGTVLGESEALRVRFDDAGQIVRPVPPQPLERIDTTGADDPRAAAEAWMRADLGRRVDLRSQPAVRHALIHYGPDRRLLYLRFHHIVLDGFGSALYLRRIAKVYSALAAGLPPPPAQTLSLANLVAEDRAYTGSAAHDQDRAYWHAALADRPAPISLSGRLAGHANHVLRRTVTLEPETVAAIHRLAETLDTTSSAVLIAAVSAYVARITGREQLLLSVPVPARRGKAAQATAAMLANQLPLRVAIELRGAPPRTTRFADLVAQVTARLVELTRHQRYRGELLHRDLALAGTGAQLGSPTVNAIAFGGDLTFADVHATTQLLSAGPVRDLALNFLVAQDAPLIQLVADADADLYSAAALAAHTRQLVALLRDASGRPEAPIAALQLMTAADRQAVLDAGTGAAVDYDLDRCLHELVAAQVARTPAAVAVECAGQALRYAELFDAAGRLAQHLQQHGAGPGRVVGVHAERSLELVIALLAVLRAGAAYLPLDPELPPQRLAFQIEDAGAVVVLSRSDGKAALAGARVPVLAVDQVLPTLPAATELAAGAGPGDPAYVIYTSGSTGRPKGVAVPHRGVVNRLLWMQDEYGLTGDDRVLHKTPFTFDVSVWELFWPLLSGARLHLAPPGAHRDPRALAELISAHAITTLHFVPTMLDLFLAEPAAANLPSLRRVFASGEALAGPTVGAFYARHDARLHNLYGPTEASIDVTYWPCQPEDATRGVPIGRAVANTRIVILDPGGELVPFGVPGELHIGGVQVATGYVNRPELTAERFIADRFGDGTGTLYRTGDLATLGADGVVAYLGRLDDQIKIRGFRVELGEIEATLLAHPAVAQAAVVAVANPDGSRRLVAYVVLAGTPDRDVERDLVQGELLALARAQLPDYMVPAQISVQPSLPQLTSGKVDRNALLALAPTPISDAAATAAVEPATEAETLLHDVWCEVLGHRRLDVATSFFALGGDSIQSIKMRAALERRGYTFTVTELFAFPTVQKLAARLRRYDGRHDELATAAFSLISAEDRAAMPADVDDAYPLTNLQTGILFHAAYGAESSVYRVVTSLHIGLPLDARALAQAIDGVMRRHPALRSSLHLTGFHEPLQLVHREVPPVLELRDDLIGLPRDAQDRALHAWAEQAKFQDFELTRAPLLAFTAHRRDDRSFQLTAVEHHALIDGWSDKAMLAELVARYQAQLAGDELWLPEVASTFHRFIAAERRIVQDPAHRAFWQTALAGVEPSPLPRPSSRGRRSRGHRHRRFDVAVAATTSAQLTAAAQRLQLPLKSLLAAAHLAVLHAVCPGPDVLTGVVSHARLAEPGGDQVIGLFLNTLPLRVQVAGATWTELARRVYEHEGQAAPHRGYPYGLMVRDSPGLALDSYINFLDFRQPGEGNAISGFGIAETDFPLAVNFLLDRSHGALEAWLDCDLGVLDAAFCERLVGYYERALHALAADPDRAATSIDLRDAEERRTIAAWSDTPVDYDATATIHGVFARQAQRTPQAVAVAFGDDQLRYAELDARAWRLAHYLRQRGATRGGRIGVHVRRGPDLVATLLAVLRTGAAYVPLDPDFPPERLQYVRGDAGLDCVITDDPHGPMAADRAVCLPACAEAIATCPGHAAELAADVATSEDVAYLMYTSGSTGYPKGTAIRHRNVINLFAGMDLRVGIGPGERLLALTSISFDISVNELLWPLTRGAEVVVAPERMIEHLSPGGGEVAFSELCLRHNPTLVQATPSFFTAVTSVPEALLSLSEVRALLITGEVLPARLARDLFAALPDVQVFNLYGPTETTVESTIHELDRARDAEADALPIGRPVANTHLRIVDPHGHEVPIGVAGELWIGGHGVGVGYRGLPELTAQKFVTLETAGDASRWYRTGDRVRWRDDGILEFLGRLDRQIKIAGHRVELDEIEGVLSRHPSVASVAVVAAARASGATELVAFVAPADHVVADDAQAAQLARWQEVWDLAYAEPASVSDGDRAGDDFAGWRSSYTAEPIPVAQMRSWLGHAVARCAALQPRRVVDVGVGVGLFLRELAPRCDSYLGFDVADVALRRAEAALSARGGARGEVRLQRGEALALMELPDRSADLVLLNSVVQYFPSADYLRSVLIHALRVVGPAGAVFVGDVRDLALLDAFHAHVQVVRSDALTPAVEVAAAARRARAAERELCLTREFFLELAASVPELGEVRVELKRGTELNELTRFRYDVTLLGAARAAAARGDRVSRRWSELAASARPALSTLSAQLAQLSPDVALTVLDVPNPRLIEPLAALDLLAAGGQRFTTAWDLQRALWECDAGDAALPEQLHALGASAMRPTALVPAASRDPARFDVVFAAEEEAA